MKHILEEGLASNYEALRDIVEEEEVGDVISLENDESQEESESSQPMSPMASEGSRTYGNLRKNKRKLSMISSQESPLKKASKRK